MLSYVIPNESYHKITSNMRSSSSSSSSNSSSSSSSRCIVHNIAWSCFEIEYFVKQYLKNGWLYLINTPGALFDY